MPDVGVTLAGALVVISLLLFVVFLDRFIHRLRPVAVAALVARAGKRALRESVAGLPDSDTLASTACPEGAGVHVATTPSGGAVQAVAIAGLVEWAEKHDCTLVIRHPVGEFVPAGSALFELHGASPPTAIVERRLRGMVALGLERTIEQDPGFAIRIMVDIAIKALSAAINDPTTAVQVMDHLEDMLLLIGDTDLAARTYRCDAQGRLRVVVPAASWEDILSQGVTEIRQYGASSVQVMRRLTHCSRCWESTSGRSTAPPWTRSCGDWVSPSSAGSAGTSTLTAPPARIVRASAARRPSWRRMGPPAPSPRADDAAPVPSE